MSGFYQRVYSWLGWKRVGEIPRDIKKMVIIAAPHTSWHDFYMALLYRKIIGLEIKFVGKKELFRWPFGWYFRKVGGMPLDRTPGQNKVQAIASLFEINEELRLTLAPEGTRKKVTEWKTGFYYIALEAKVPIVPVAMDFGKKEHRVAHPFYPTGNIDEDLPKLMSFYEGVEGKISKFS
ncbi:MAG: 1-acyl-sn-glycerol-3-phosphate acyltransferase [Leeuwenhoekiella sp.]